MIYIIDNRLIISYKIVTIKEAGFNYEDDARRA